MSKPRPRNGVQPVAPTATPGAQLLRLRDVAFEMNVSMRQVQTWRASGRLPVLVFGPHCVRVERSALEMLKREARS